MGAAGPVIVFVCLLVLLVMIGGFYLCYAGRSLFVVVQQTAAGTEEVTWPDEPMFDWIWQGAALFWLLFVWLCPVAMVLRVVNPDIFSDDPGLFILAGGITLWVLFPIGVLSTMSSGSRWIVFHPKLVIDLIRTAPVTLAFYAVSAVPVGLALGMFYLALTGSFVFAPLAGACGGAAILIYARLLGRVAWKLNHRTVGRAAKRAKLKQTEPAERGVEMQDSWGPAPRKKRKKKRERDAEPSPTVDEPIALSAPEAEAADVVEDEEETGRPVAYAVAADNDSPAPKYEPLMEREADTYNALDPEPEEQRQKPVVAADIVRTGDLESRLTIQHDPDRPPALLLVTGVFEFPWVPMSVRHWFLLTIIGTIVAGVLHLALDCLPQ